MLLLIFALAFDIASASASPPLARITVEDESPAVAAEALVEPVGIETFGGVFTQLLPVGCGVPCEKTELFSTAADRQTELRVSLYRGRGKMVAQAHALGTFTIRGWDAAPRGVPAIAVTVAVVGRRIELRAVDRKGRRPLILARAKK
jgi:molecular chaperone DnaK